MLSHYQQERLKAQVRPLINDHYQSSENPSLEAVIADIKKQSPHKFHTDQTLKDRVFFNQPRRDVPSAGFIHPRPRDYETA